MEKEIKINVPDGYEIDKENSTFKCIKFKPIEKKLPKTWEEYCKTHPIKRKEVYIDESGYIHIMDAGDRNIVDDKTVLPSKKYAEAMVALCQLIQLRDCYNDGWIPNWTEGSSLKYCIEINKNEISKFVYYVNSKVLAFKTKEICDKFLGNFYDLIEIAKPLL